MFRQGDGKKGRWDLQGSAEWDSLKPTGWSRAVWSSWSGGLSVPKAVGQPCFLMVFCSLMWMLLRNRGASSRSQVFFLFFSFLLFFPPPPCNRKEHNGYSHSLVQWYQDVSDQDKTAAVTGLSGQAASPAVESRSACWPGADHQVWDL